MTIVPLASPDTRLDAVFSALADPTRRAILARLSRGEASVTELASPFEMSLPAISKHLRILETTGLVRRARDGRRHHIRLAAGPMKTAAEWLDHYRDFWERRLDALEAYLGEEKRKEKPKWQRPSASPKTSSSSSGGSSRSRASASSRHSRRPKN